MEFTQLILEEGRPAGIKARFDGGELAIRAPLVVDASGVDGVIRWKSARSGLGVEEIRSMRRISYVILQYWTIR